MFSSLVQNGTVLSVVTLDGSRRFPVTISSSRPIARGGTSAVIQGRIAGGGSLEHLVAIKVLPTTLDGNQKELLRRELRAARHASLSGQPVDGILHTLGISELGLSTAIVTPFMSNGNLLAYLRAEKWADRKRLLSIIARTVCDLHVKYGLVHGDLKCENILVSDSGQPLLADFGLATFVEKSAHSAATSTAFRQLYTLRFAAPELLDEPTERADGVQIQPRSKTRESDVFAFGMLILQAFTGMPPWAGYSDITVMRDVCLGQLPPRPRYTADFFGLSDSWWDLCLRCWKFLPQDRPGMEDVWAQTRWSTGVDLPGHTFSVKAVFFTHDGTRIVTGAGDGTIHVWNIAQQDMHDTPPAQPSVAIATPHGLTCMLELPGNRIATCAGEDNIRVWDAVSGAEIGRPMHHAADIRSIACSPDGTCVVSVSSDNAVCFWDASTGNQICQLPAARGRELDARKVAFSPDGEHIATASPDAIHIWNVDALTISATLVSAAGIGPLAFSPDGTRVAAGLSDHTVCIWDLSTGEPARVIRGHAGSVTTVAFSPTGQYLASAAEDLILAIWNAASGELAAPLRVLDDDVGALAFSSDGSAILYGSRDGVVTVLKLI